jgi:glycosyltransferase involved in cell wall biosynthesis
MHAVIVDGDVSYPATSGKRLRTLNLMLRLAQRHRVTYLARGQGDPAQTRQAHEFLSDHHIQPVLVDDPLPKKSGPGFYLRLAANLLSPLPYSVATHIRPRMRAAVAAHAAANAVDVWQFEFFPYLGTLRDPAARKVLIAHNVESLMWQRYYENAAGPLRRWYVKRQWRKYERAERRGFAEATRVVAVSPEDAALVRERFGQPNVDVVDNGIDRAFFESVRPDRDPNLILFLGALDWRPNLDGLALLLDRVFPEVRARHPEARLWVVGRNPPVSLPQRVAAAPGAELHADVADVRPYLARSGVMAVPLRIGGGSRLKILESLACGLPVVSTRVGAEGLALNPERHLFVVDDMEGMAEGLLRCLRAPGPAQEMAQVGRAAVLERYDWDALALKLEAVWEKSRRHADAQQSAAEIPAPTAARSEPVA